MSLSDESMEKLEDVKNKVVQYIVMKIDDVEASVPMVELEIVGPKGSSYDKFVNDLTKAKDCRFGVFSYMVNKKSHPVVFYYSPHESNSLTQLCFTNTNSELKRSSFKGLAEIHVSDAAKLNADEVTAKLEEYY